MTQNRKSRRAWAAATRQHVKRGRVYILEFQHDAWCGIYTAERTCTCNPHRVLKDDEGHVLATVEGAGFYDPLEILEAVK